MTDQITAQNYHEIQQFDRKITNRRLSVETYGLLQIDNGIEVLSPNAAQWELIGTISDEQKLPYDSNLLRYSYECQCHECCHRAIPENFPDLIPLSQQGLLVVDSKESHLPRTYRNLNESLGLSVSASGQMNTLQIQHIVEDAQWSDDYVIVDLRQESHGYVNGSAVSWYRCCNLENVNLRPEDVAGDEVNRVRDLQIEGGIMHEITFKVLGSIYKSHEVPFQPGADVIIEADMAKRLGCLYARFPVLDHQRATDGVVDDFVNYIRTLKGTEWLHFHCRGGRGRSTSFLMMYDMITNEGIDWTLEDFMQRQKTVGGSDLLQSSMCKNKRWKRDVFDRRAEFLRQFHAYTRCQNGYRAGYNWSTWQELAGMGRVNCICSSSHCQDYVNSMTPE